MMRPLLVLYFSITSLIHTFSEVQPLRHL